MYLGQTRQRDEPTTATHQREADKQKDPFFSILFLSRERKLVIRKCNFLGPLSAPGTSRRPPTCTSWPPKTPFLEAYHLDLWIKIKYLLADLFRQFGLVLKCLIRISISDLFSCGHLPSDLTHCVSITPLWPQIVYSGDNNTILCLVIENWSWQQIVKTLDNNKIK